MANIVSKLKKNTKTCCHKSKQLSIPSNKLPCSFVKFDRCFSIRDRPFVTVDTNEGHGLSINLPRHVVFNLSL